MGLHNEQRAHPPRGPSPHAREVELLSRVVALERELDDERIAGVRLGRELSHASDAVRALSACASELVVPLTAAAADPDHAIAAVHRLSSILHVLSRDLLGHAVALQQTAARTLQRFSGSTGLD